RTTGAYARIREQFNVPIGKFEGIEEPLARIAGTAYLLDAARRLTCAALNQGHHPAVISGIMKLHATERMRLVIDDAMDIHGGVFAPAPEAGEASGFYRQLSRHASAFALCADMALLTLGGALKRREMLSARFGDILSEMYLLSAALKRWQDEGRQSADFAALE